MSTPAAMLPAMRRVDKERPAGAGFQGQIVDAGKEFHVRVASMEDFDKAKAIRQKLVDSGFPKAFATRTGSD